MKFKFSDWIGILTKPFKKAAPRMLSMRLFHGSEIRNITSFNLDYSDHYAPFGPAIYLTESMRVAEYYKRWTGVIYELNVEGNDQYIIDLDKPLNEQTPVARKILIQLIKRKNRKEFLLSTQNVRFMLDEMFRHHSTLFIRNRILLEHGIWMLFGELSEMEKSGTRDQGIQYAVLSPENIKSFRPVEV